MSSNLGPRSNAQMLNDVSTSYDKALYSCDSGMWTVYEIVKRPVAKVASESEANKLIGILERSRPAPVTDRGEKGGTG